MLSLAVRAVTSFAETGFEDKLAPHNSFTADKVVAETAMLLHAAAHVRDKPVIRGVFEQLLPLVTHHARSARVLADMALHPQRVHKHVVPHVLLNALGSTDEAFDAFARERWDLASRLACDLTPSADAERAWIRSLWTTTPHSTSDARSWALLAHPFDVLTSTRGEVYALTHVLFYLTDFGHRRKVELPRPAQTLMADIEALLMRFLDAEDYDLAGELLTAWPQLGIPWSTTAVFAFRVLLTVEDEVGLLPCGNASIARFNTLSGPEQSRYALATSYHTAYVMGFLCAAALLPDHSLPAEPAQSTATNTTSWEAAPLGTWLGDDRGHWQSALTSISPELHAALAPALCSLAILQRMRLTDYAGLRELLLAAHDMGLGELPLASQATDRLMAVAHAAAIRGALEQAPRPRS